MTLAGMAVALNSDAGAEQGLFVVTTDFQTGSTAFLAPKSQTPETNLLTIHSDAVARYYDGRVYVINRLGQDNILVLDEADLRTPLIQFSVGNGTNPQDIEFAGPDKAYVSRLASTSVLVVNPQDGTQLGEIDLSGFADGDGFPEISEMAMVGSRLYVACQRLDQNSGFVPTDVSYLVVVDAETDAVIDVDPEAEGVQGIPLAATNPNKIVAVGQQIIVSAMGGFGDREGGVEVVDAVDYASSGLVISEADLGGDITFLAMVSSTRGFAIVSDENFVNWLKPVDLASGAVGAALAGHSGGFTPSMVVDGARLIVADRGTFSDPDAAGLLIYDAVSGKKTAGPIPVGLPPLDIAVLGDVEIPTAVLEEAVSLPQQAILGAGYPNPFNAGIQIPFEVQNPQTRVSLVVYDALGRKIRTLVDGFAAAGSNVVSWDGRSDAGALVGSGTYLVELRVGAWHAAGKVTLVK